jgi:hypothetical protein
LMKTFVSKGNQRDAGAGDPISKCGDRRKSAIIRKHWLVASPISCSMPV